MKKLILLTGLLFILLITTKAENYNLDLEKSIDIAKEKSIRMAKLTEDLKIAENNLKAATSRLKTHVDFEFASPQFSRSIQRDYRSSTLTYYSDKSLFYSGDLSISQPLPTAGTLSLISGLSNKNYYYLQKQEPTLYSYIDFKQPLNALYGYNEVRSSLKIAKLNYESSRKRYKRRELDLTYDISNAFYNAISVQKAAEIAKLNLERQKEAYETNKRKYEAGLIKEVDALKMEVDLDQAQNDYELAVLNQNSAMNTFKNLIGIQLSDSVTLSSELKYETVIVDTEKAVQLALQNRLEIREQEIAIEQNKLNIKEQKSKGMIQSSLNMSYGRRGVGNEGLDKDGREIPIELNSSITRAFDKAYLDLQNRGPVYGIGLTVKVPILDGGGNKANVRIAQSALKQNQLEMDETKRAIEQEVRNLVADLNSSLKRLQLLDKTVSIAEKSFEITRQRFADGNVTSEEMTLERTRLNTTYNSHLSAYSTYQLKLADLTRKTFYDFKNDLPIK